MSRVDLDAIGRILDQPFTVLGTPVVAVDDETGRALVAELRAAREVIAAILDDTNDVSMRVDIALDEYEKAVGS